MNVSSIISCVPTLTLSQVTKVKTLNVNHEFTVYCMPRFSEFLTVKKHCTIGILHSLEALLSDEKNSIRNG